MEFKPGCFYIVKASDTPKQYCLYANSRDDGLMFLESQVQGVYVYDYMWFSIFSSRHADTDIQEIDAPQVMWISPLLNPGYFTSYSSDSDFYMALCTRDVTGEFKEAICSLADVKDLLEDYDWIQLKGVGTFQITARGMSCSNSIYSGELRSLCRTLFQPKDLLADFGLTPEGVEMFLKEGRFNSWENMKDKPGFYECNGVIRYLPSLPENHLKNAFIPFFLFDAESGCYTEWEFSSSGPCNLMDYVPEIYVGLKISWTASIQMARGAYILSRTFRSCTDIAGDRVFWTLGELLEWFDDLPGKYPYMNLLHMQMEIRKENGKVHMVDTGKTRKAYLDMRTLFLAQSDF